MNRITYEGKQYDIPPKTIEVLKAEDACNAFHATHEEAYRAKFEYLKTVLTDEQIESMLGSADFEQVDLMEVLYIVALSLGSILAIFVLWLCFFTPGKRLAQTPENVAAGLLGQPAAPVVSREERP